MSEAREVSVCMVTSSDLNKHSDQNNTPPSTFASCILSFFACACHDVS